MYDVSTTSNLLARIIHRQIANPKEASLLSVGSAIFCCQQPLLILPPSIAPSMFGRDLAEQIRADAKGGDRKIPVIVEKCIDAVNTLGTLIS
jgi:hypothetical protein